MAHQPADGFKTGTNARLPAARIRRMPDAPLSRTGRLAKILRAAVILFFLLAASPAAWSQKAADSSGPFLGERHKTAGIACSRCHGEKPAAPVAAGICAGCHPNVAKTEKIREDLPNPHNAHMDYPDCTDCHHVHKASENQCGQCHNFDYKMR
ncbi:MAG: cytochrome c3 family protein [Smithellaceae bacterium]|nr:cytochrome c3 family protein [Smithellaceae bacterium]NLX52445.1 cytochrome c3 family protein [Deltaproteobacteria bacterium]